MTAPTDNHTAGDRVIDWLRSPHLTTILGFATIAVVIVTLALAALYGPDILNSTSAVETGTNLTGCRSSYAAAVTDKRTEFDIARSDRDSIDSVADVKLLALARAALFGDDATVDRIQTELEPLEDNLAEANARVDEADQALIDANDIYQAALVRSREDPARFLADCDAAGL